MLGRKLLTLKDSYRSALADTMDKISQPSDPVKSPYAEVSCDMLRYADTSPESAGIGRSSLAKSLASDLAEFSYLWPIAAAIKIPYLEFS